MKKILWFALALAMTLAFVSCEDDGPSMNEDYAGVWYLDMSVYNMGVMKIDMTDTTFENSMKVSGATSYVLAQKGTVKKVSEGAAVNTLTHAWDDTTDSWEDIPDVEDAFTYELSADGTTLTVVSESNGTMVLSSTEP